MPLPRLELLRPDQILLIPNIIALPKMLPKPRPPLSLRDPGPLMKILQPTNVFRIQGQEVAPESLRVVFFCVKNVIFGVAKKAIGVPHEGYGSRLPLHQAQLQMGSGDVFRRESIIAPDASGVLAYDILHVGVYAAEASLVGFFGAGCACLLSMLAKDSWK